MTRNLAELDHRESNGIAVTLLWNRTTGAVLVRVVDECSDEDFEVDCAPHEALAVFHHPFAYTATRPVHYRQRTVAG
jgi:hypothetical protein